MPLKDHAPNTPFVSGLDFIGSINKLICLLFVAVATFSHMMGHDAFALRMLDGVLISFLLGCGLAVLFFAYCCMLKFKNRQLNKTTTSPSNR